MMEAAKFYIWIEENGSVKQNILSILTSVTYFCYIGTF